jgi:Glycosyl hydrolase family 76
MNERRAGRIRIIAALGTGLLATACGDSGASGVGGSSGNAGNGHAGAGTAATAGTAGMNAQGGSSAGEAGTATGGANSASGAAGSAGSSVGGTDGGGGAAGSAGTNAGGGGAAGQAGSAGSGGAGPTKTYAEYAKDAFDALLKNFYSAGKWKAYPAATAKNHDWGDDSLTYDLYFRWLLTGDATIPPQLEALAASMSTPPAPCATANGCGPWSDEYLWDSLAGSREHEATNNATALSKAIAGFDYVDKTTVFSGGACPGIYWQKPDHTSGGLKTAETDTNYLRAALALYKRTNDAGYLDKAKTMYAAIRQFYLDTRGDALYSVYVFDTAGTCAQKTGRYYSSVNGNMIYSGMKLKQYTGDAQYLTDALATAHDVDTKLADPSGIHADLQAENDLVEPLVEAMYALYAEEQQAFAKTWIMRNAAAAVSSIQPATGSYGRFFNGPPPVGTITEFQSNGGFALMFAAAKLDPTGIPTPGGWDAAVSHPNDLVTAMLPASINFTGTAIALIGTIGEQCCEAGHAKVFVDGVETNDTTGIWQNKSSASISIADSVLFAWAWPTAGAHTIQIQDGIQNGKEGGSFVHIQKYLVKP